MAVLTHARKVQFLSSIPFFENFASPEWEAIATRLNSRRFTDGEVIFMRGDPGSTLMILVEGRVRIGVNTSDGREMLLTIMEPGQIFGEMSLLDGQARSADATAMGETLVLALERADFLATLRQFPESALRLCAMLSQKLRRSTDQVEGVTLHPVNVRLARLLLTIAGQSSGQSSNHPSSRSSKPPSNPASAGTPRTKGSPTQRDLGQLIGASRQKVNFHLGQWQAEGIIARDGNAFAIQNWKALQAIANSDAE
jgi:CRP/FNR family cyclic AMP-dependent transcriptional regulator